MNVTIRQPRQNIAVLSASTATFGSYPRSESGFTYKIPEKAPGSTFESSARVGCSRLTATVPSAVRKPPELEAQLQG